MRFCEKNSGPAGASVFAGSDAGFPPEKVTESLGVIEAQQLRNVGERVVGLQQETADMIDQAGAEKLARGFAGGGFDALFEEAA